jgi:MFS family permease
LANDFSFHLAVAGFFGRDCDKFTGISRFLVAGALADVVDRRRLLLFTQFWMLVAAAGLGILTLADGTTPWGLLGFTFFLNIGAALNGPAWLAIVPELVARDEIPSAVAFNSVALAIHRGSCFGSLRQSVCGEVPQELQKAIKDASRETPEQSIP